VFFKFPYYVLAIKIFFYQLLAFTGGIILNLKISLPSYQRKKNFSDMLMPHHLFTARSLIEPPVANFPVLYWVCGQ